MFAIPRSKMADPSGNPEPTRDLLSACPYGIINIPAVLESYLLLHASDEDMHHHLRTWLATAYLDGNTQLSSMNEPLGRRIRCLQDLGMLVCAYGQARALKRPKTNAMQHELYFYGQGPRKEEGLQAGKWMQQWAKKQIEMVGLKGSRKPPLGFGEGEEQKEARKKMGVGSLLPVDGNLLFGNSIAPKGIPAKGKETVASVRKMSEVEEKDNEEENEAEEADGWLLT
ncbi:uncharacterized protein CC84DRAFT_497422 [Paraphaeosphaeria sporulosa]|uniref:Uncharacterized protein n=1 Tax=Paraphaeosphaeria sporulosa TaxID=1460663 RepID=A0A177CUI8_9PLEO|nr:uncharacterized protein CC84DRAFT_497422 [Paraphaeosphaeria sporulosa]OAG10906.1 hypothetical protein CC84DRAFT_497422 [Paraphaeosphaeria sporulosa]